MQSCIAWFQDWCVFHNHLNIIVSLYFVIMNANIIKCKNTFLMLIKIEKQLMSQWLLMSIQQPNMCKIKTTVTTCQSRLSPCVWVPWLCLLSSPLLSSPLHPLLSSPLLCLLFYPSSPFLLIQDCVKYCLAWTHVVCNVLH